MGKLSNIIESSLSNAAIPIKKSVISESKSSEAKVEKVRTGWSISEEDLNRVRLSVRDVDSELDQYLGRDEYILRRYGHIVDPKTNKRFNIPYLDIKSDDYIFNYAKKMQILVDSPETFKKIMDWE